MKRRDTPSRTPPGQRQLRVGERIRHILAEVLRRGDLHDPVLAQASLITVTAVEIGPDLKHATAYIMPLGGKNADVIVHALNRASGYFRTEIGRELDLHSTPKISFRIDVSFEQAAHIENILRQERVRKDVVAAADDDEG
jgi:ribosome-binding factor A